MSKYVKSFTPFYESGWENQPSENTPIMGEALNAYDSTFVKIEEYLESYEPDIPQGEIPTKVSELENDAGYLTEETVKDVEFPNLVPTSRTIAGIDLADDITAEDLSKTLDLDKCAYIEDEESTDDIIIKEFLPYPKDESGNPIAGSENQILMSNGDGSTKWGEASSVSFFQTELKNVNVNVYSDVTIDTLRLPKGVYIISSKCYYEGIELRYVQRLKAPATFTNNSGYDPAGNVLLSLTGIVELTEETDVIYQVYLNKENVTTIMLKDIQIKAIKLS